MGFDSGYFWLIFIGVVAAYYSTAKSPLRNAFLLICSYLFYASWSWTYLPIIIISTLTDYLCGFWAGKDQPSWRRRLALSTSLFINLGLLIGFKYTGRLLPDHAFAIPLGISFYTFQTLSYTIDIYRGKLQRTKSLLNFALYVSFFPQLVMGPIEKARRLLPQIENPRRLTWERAKEGFYLIILGLFKKIFVANSIAVAVDRVFTEPNPPSSLALLASLLMVCQVYCDFSGYSDMARGMARFFGIDLMINFKPFFTCRKPSQFWQNWHISLTQWIRDYAVIPFRDKKKREWHLYVQLLLIMSLVGLWHDATWNWLCFGWLHGFAIIADRFLSRQKWSLPVWITYPFGYLSMLSIYVLSGALHRSQDWSHFTKLFHNILQFENWGVQASLFVLYSLQFILPLFVYEAYTLWKKDEFTLLKKPLWLQGILLGMALTCILILSRVSPQGFLYYSF